MAIATATAIALAASLASAGAGVYNANKTAKRQDNQAAAGIRQQAADQREINARLNKTLDQTAKSTSADEKMKAGDSYRAAIAKSIGQANAGLATKGLSSQFDELAGQGAKDVSNYGGNIADLFARMDAPIAQRRNEGNAFGDLGMQTGILARNAAGDDFLNRLKLQAIRPNPWLTGAQGILSGVASGAGSWGTGTASAGSPAALRAATTPGIATIFSGRNMANYA